MATLGEEELLGGADPTGNKIYSHITHRLKLLAVGVAIGCILIFTFETTTKSLTYSERAKALMLVYSDDRLVTSNPENMYDVNSLHLSLLEV